MTEIKRTKFYSIIELKCIYTKEKWLLLAEMLDALEEDFRRIYPNDTPPFEHGYKETLKKLME